MRQIGGFDEDFFLYGEDQDLCLRIRKLGYEIGVVETAEVVHHGGKSERGSAPPEVWGKKVRAEYLFYEKHYLPGTIRKIMRSHLARARWRLAVLNVSLPFAGDRATAIGKIQKYQALQDVARQQRARTG
jgi:GT2 family glycosyltransferase